MDDGGEREVLGDGARWGERFVAPVGTPRGPGWIAATDLFGPRLPAVLAEVGAARGTTSPAVAGALLADAYAQRVVASVVGALVVDGTVLDASPPRVRVALDGGSIRRLAFAEAPVAADPGGGLRRMAEGLLEDLDEVLCAVHEHTRVGMRVLDGAVAHAVAITFLHLSWPDSDRARHVDTAREFLAATPRWEGLVTVRAEIEAGRRWMYTDRNTCCLAFRTAVNQAREQPYCATCPVLPRAVTREMFGQATASYAQRHPE